MTKYHFTNILFGALVIAQVLFLDVRTYQFSVPVTMGIYVAILSMAVTSMRMQYFCKSIYHGPRDQCKIALTFDDGPDPQTTPVLLDLLGKHNIKATFFVIGAKAEKYPDLVKRLADAGHLIANHSYTHPWYHNFLFGNALEQQIVRTETILRNILGSTSGFFRPPMGLTSPHYRKILNKHDLKMVGWDIRTFDRNRNQHQVVETIVNNIRNGSIILMHDSGVVIEQVQYVICKVAEILRKHGYSFVKINEMVAPYGN